MLTFFRTILSYDVTTYGLGFLNALYPIVRIYI